MKLQKQLSRRVKNKEYMKWVIVLPHQIVKKLGWEEGQEIEIKIRNKKLILEQKK